MENSALMRIYNNINAGKTYGQYHTTQNLACGETIFYDALYITRYGNIGYTHYGSSAHENTLAGLDWILKTIFGMTPEQFLKNYVVEI